jgi:hypothetical protein
MAETKSMAGPGMGVMPIIGAFVAGIIGVLVFHQLAFLVLHWIGVTPAMPYNMTPTKPLSVPQVLSSAFWGGVWAILMAWLLRGREGGNYWTFAIVFGAVVVTLGAWFLVPWIKGLPTVLERPLTIAIIIGPVVNGAWGFGTALVLKLLPAGWAWR